MTFADLGLSDELLRAVNDSGYNEPTPIQRAAIPSVLMGKDLIGIAQTGTGKTAGFVLPMLDILHHGRSRALMPRSLILEPTRELAMQVSENFDKYGKYHPLSMELLVIDEADRMLDMGFIPDIEEICSKLPKSRQTLLFSATMPPPIQKLAAKFLKDPKRVEVSRPATANINIEQKVVEVSADKKKDALKELLRAEGVKNAIIFCNRKTTVRELAGSLRRAHFAAGQIHGDMEQSERISEFDRFKQDEINILVASDVAARGLDVKGVSHVFNFDAPWQPDDYIHRIGRTGRAGAKGIAITLATKADGELIERIEKLTGQKIPRVNVPDRAAKPSAKKKPELTESDEPRKKAEPRETIERGAKGRKQEPRKDAPSPVVEDLKNEWNGPLPSFLSVSAA